jgi:cytochrome P450
MNKAEQMLSDEDLALWCSQFDHHDASLNHDNVYQIYEQLRVSCPITRSERYGGFWVVSHYADIVTALMDPSTFCSGQGVHIPRQEGQMKVIPIDFDPPLHTQYRRIFTEVLAPRQIRPLEPFIQRIIGELLASFVDHGGGDFVHDVAMPLPIGVISGILGLSEQTTNQIRELTEQIWAAFGREQNPAPLRNLIALLLREANERRLHPQDDFLTTLVQMTVDERPLRDEELQSILISFAVAGHETTMNAAGNLLFYLAERPEEQERLRQHPALIPDVVEESLRYNTPAHLFARTVTHDTTLGGAQMKQGDKVALLLASGNRDPEQFNEPDQFVPGRKSAGQHLAFGRGIHLCSGATLARTELRLLLEVLLLSYPPFRVNGEVVWSHMEGGHHMGVRSLPMTLLQPSNASK